jgi:hypothetical protein
MPAYLCHGFRWHRRSIRVYVVVQNIDDAAPEWIIAPASSTAILESFYTLFDFLPELPPRQQQHGRQQSEDGDKAKRKNAGAGRTQDPPEFAIPPPTVPPKHDDVLHNEWSAVKLLEEYDPTNLDAVSRPYAFVADYVTRVDLSVSVAEEIVRYEERQARLPADVRAVSMVGNQSDEFYKQKKASSSTGRRGGWFEKLRDQLQRGEDIRWFVVVCGDEERFVPEDIKYQGRPRDGGVLVGFEHDKSRSQSRSQSQSGSQSRSQSRSRSQSQSQSSQIQSHSQGQDPSQGSDSRSRSHSQSQSQSHRGTPTVRQDDWPSYQSGGLSVDPVKSKSGLRRLFGKRHEDSP